MTLQEFLIWIKGLIEASAPAVAVIFWNYEQTKVDEASNEALDAKVKLELEKNHESVDDKYSNCPDINVINDAIASARGPSGIDSASQSAGNSTDPGSKKS